MRPAVEAFFRAHAADARAPAAAAPRAGGTRMAAVAADAPPLVEFDGVTISYPASERPVFDGLRWTVREGEKWVVAGGNGSGKSTLVELITGDNQLGYQVRLSHPLPRAPFAPPAERF